MSNLIKDTVLKAIIDAQIAELMPKTRASQIELTEGVTLAAKLAEMIAAINIRAKIADVEGKFDEIHKEIDSQILAVKQELLGDVPVEAYDTFTELAQYISEHEEISDMLTEAIGAKADQTTVDGIVATLNALGALAHKDKVTEADLDAALSNKIINHTHVIGDVSGLQDALDYKVPTSRKVNGKSLNEDITLTAEDVGATTLEYVDAAFRDSLNYIESEVSHIESSIQIFDERIDLWNDALKEDINSLTKAVNTKVEQDEYNTHINDMDIHITPEERTLWNTVKKKVETDTQYTLSSTLSPIETMNRDYNVSSSGIRHKISLVDSNDTVVSELAEINAISSVQVGPASVNIGGLMSKEDKAKLNGIALGAEVNQNAFSSVKVGDKTISADSKTDTLTIEAGDNVAISADTATDKIVISMLESEDITQTAEKTLLNSYEGGIKVNEIGGVSEQQSTTGVQLFDLYNPTKPGEIISENGSFTVNSRWNSHRIELSDTVTISFEKGKLFDVFRYALESDGVIVRKTTTETAITVPKDNTDALWICVATDDAQRNVMVNFGDTALPWEPYTGGSPSPSPDYPQKIKSVKGKNLLKNTATTRTKNGITFTVNSDGSVMASGTATADVSLVLNTDMSITSDIILSGCPNGGSHTTYNLYAGEHLKDGTWVMNHTDLGSGKMIPRTDNVLRAIIIIKNGTTVSDITFHPMIRPASIADDTYVPYGCLRVKERGKNLLQNIVVSSTHRGVDYVANEDKSLTINGTATELGWRLIGTVLLDTGTYIVSGCPNGGSIDGYRVDLRYDKDGQSVVYPESVDYGYGAKITITEPTTVHYAIRLVAGVKYNNITFYPMIREASVENDTYEPYQEKAITLSSPITLNGIGDVQDRIVRKDGVWGTERKFAEVVFDGSDDEEWYKSATTGAHRYYVFLNDIFASLDCNFLCSQARKVNTTSTTENFVAFITPAKQFAINTNFLALAEWKAHLQADPMTVLYELATTTFEPLPTADQIALNSLQSFDGVTYLYIDSEVQPTTDVEYGTSRVGGVALEAWNESKSSKYTDADSKVTQTNVNDNNNYRVLLSTNPNNDDDMTGEVHKSTHFRANPSTGTFYARGYDRVDITGQTLDLNSLTLLEGSPDIMRCQCRSDAGSTNIANRPNADLEPFILDVELIRWTSSTDYATKQTYISSRGADNKSSEYVRYCTNGTWTDWTKRVFTDTTYNEATTTKGGLMSAADKIKLDGISESSDNGNVGELHDLYYTSSNGASVIGGYFTKIGNLVNVVVLTSVTAADTNGTKIINFLPYPPAHSMEMPLVLNGNADVIIRGVISKPSSDLFLYTLDKSDIPAGNLSGSFCYFTNE